MKKLLALCLFWMALMPAIAQNRPLSLYNIRKDWDDKTYTVCEPGASTDVVRCVLEFAEYFPGYPMLDALKGRISGEPDDAAIPVADFRLDKDNGYVMIRLQNEELAETEARLWTLPDGKQVFVIKFVDHADGTSEQICFFNVDRSRGVLSRTSSPKGFYYGYIDNLLLSPDGREIIVKWQHQPADRMILQDDGSFLYEEFAPNAISCYISDPDPSHRTNIRATPGGKIIGQLSPDDNAEEEDDWDGGSSYILQIYNPQNGWWQILNFSIGKIEIKDQAWIHYSVLSMHTRNYGGQTLNLYESPTEESRIVGKIKEEAADIRPIDVNADGSWVKVKYKKKTGWISSYWLCANPYTYCS